MMPALHNFITVSSPKFFGDNNNLQIIFSMIKLVLDSQESGEEAESHALKLLEVLIFQGGAETPGVIDNAIRLAYHRAYETPNREIETAEMRTMVTTVLLSAIYVDKTDGSVSFLSSKQWIDEGLKQWLTDFDSIFGIHDRRLSLLVMAKFLTCPQPPQAILEQAGSLLPKCLHLFKGLESAYQYRANEDSDDEGGADSDDEFDMNENDESLPAPNVNRGNIEQLDDDESDDENEAADYLKCLENFRLNDEIDMGETQYEDYTTVIDEDGIPYLGLTKDSEGTVEQHDIPDEYIEFNQALQHLSETKADFFTALMGSLSQGDQTDFKHVQQMASKRLEDKRSKSLEKQGGYKFSTNVDQIDMNFTAN